VKELRKMCGGILVASPCCTIRQEHTAAAAETVPKRRLPKRRVNPASQPLGVDAEGLAQHLERERAVAVATLNPGEITMARARTPSARGEQAAQAVLEHREPELQFAGERLTREPNGHATAP
jgi:hypothetical protein